MRNNYLSAGCIMLALLASGPARAQDFSGPYVGVQGGWQQTEVRNPETDLGAATLDADRQSFTTGLFVGYDREVARRIVLGVEGGMDLSTDDTVEGTSATGMVSIDPEWSLDLTTRAGYLVTPSMLAYVRGGYTNARVETTVTTGAARLSESENRDGWVVGAGLERQFLQNISGRLEYRYSELSENEGSFDRHRILAGIAYRF